MMSKCFEVFNSKFIEKLCQALGSYESSWIKDQLVLLFTYEDIFKLTLKKVSERFFLILQKLYDG